jgi:hypothetical protein
VPGGADLKKEAVLALERDLAVVQPPGGVHQAKSADQLFGFEPGETAGGGRVRRAG